MKGFAKSLALFLVLFGNDGTTYRHYGATLAVRAAPIKVLEKTELAGTEIEALIAFNTITIVK